MFRAVISYMLTLDCVYSLWYNASSMLPAGNIVGASTPEDGRNQRPKHVELIGIINKPLLLYLVGCLY